MINNIRTILLNTAGPRSASNSIPGDAYIPRYAPVAVPDVLKPVDQALFGSAPDYEGRVYRVTQYMKLVHNSGYDSYVYAEDSRITYDPYGVTPVIASVADFRNARYNTAVVTGGREFGVVGEWLATDGTGRVVHSWQIIATSPTAIAVVNNVTQAAAEYNTLGGLKTLPGSDLRLTTTVTQLTAGNTWTVTYRTRPQPDVGMIIAGLHGLPTTAISAVFGTHSAEPLRTFYNLFTKHPMPAQQLTGFLLAYCNKLNELRLS